MDINGINSVGVTFASDEFAPFSPTNFSLNPRHRRLWQTEKAKANQIGFEANVSKALHHRYTWGLMALNERLWSLANSQGRKYLQGYFLDQLANPEKRKSTSCLVSLS